MMNNLILIGMPGSGKTYWGQLLAKECDLPFYDLDYLIEEECQMAISSIFEKEGEDVFRQIEKELLHEILLNSKGQPMVLACGGGTPTYSNNMEVINKEGISVFLKPSIETILSNLTKDTATHRPLLHKTNSLELLHLLSTLESARLPSYKLAKHTLTEKEINLEILKRLITYA